MCFTSVTGRHRCRDACLEQQEIDSVLSHVHEGVIDPPPQPKESPPLAHTATLSKHTYSRSYSTVS